MSDLGYPKSNRDARLRDADELTEMATKMMPVEGLHSMADAIHRLLSSALVRAAADILRETPS